MADSFQGLPRPDPERWPAVPLEEVQANFARYGLLDEVDWAGVDSQRS